MPEHALEETESLLAGMGRRPAARKDRGGKRSSARSSLSKALTYAPTGGIVAAATTSLPEEIGGVRNWDYRYCWLRDATFTLLALIDAGYLEEARAWREWLLRAVAGKPEQMQIMYGVCGERRLTEFELPWLAGYENSKPVRVGNPPQASSSSMSMARCSTRCIALQRAGIKTSETDWRSTRPCSARSNQNGSGRITASGKCAVSRSISRTRR